MQAWALSICIACILAGVLEILLPERESFKSIKTVVALYILLSIVSPPVKSDWSGLMQALKHTEVDPPNYSQYVDVYSREVLADNLETTLHNAGLTGRVRVENEDGLQIYLTSDQNEQAKQVLQDALGGEENARIIFED